MGCPRDVAGCNTHERRSPLVLITGPGRCSPTEPWPQTVAALAQERLTSRSSRLQAGTYARPVGDRGQPQPLRWRRSSSWPISTRPPTRPNWTPSTPARSSARCHAHRHPSRRAEGQEGPRRPQEERVPASSMRPRDQERPRQVDFAMNEQFRAGRRRRRARPCRPSSTRWAATSSELALACQQLIADAGHHRRVRRRQVSRRQGQAATGFRVADAAVAAPVTPLALLRHAVAVGVDPVPIVANLAAQVRQLIRVGAAGRGRKRGPGA